MIELPVNPRDTGLRIPETDLRPQSQLPALTDGCVVRGFKLSPVFRVYARDVTLEDCLFEPGPGGTESVAAESHAPGLVLSHCEYRGDAAAMFGFSNVRALYCNIHGFTNDGCKLGSATEVGWCWVHDASPEQGAHADGVQQQDVVGEAGAWVHHNRIEMGAAMGNAALFLSPDLPRPAGVAGSVKGGVVTVEHNYLSGGNYTVSCVDGANHLNAQKLYVIRHNTFGREHRYGPVRCSVVLNDASGHPTVDMTAMTVQWEENYYTDGEEVQY